jgi:hypothetical protein
MIRTACLLIALCVFSMVASAQDDPLAWFPLQVGSHWVYEHEWKSGDRNQPKVDRWTSEETITGWVTIPEGVVVLREVKEHGNPEHASAYLVRRDRQPYLVHGNCVYVVSGGWDSQRQQLRPDYQRSLTEGSVSPDLCFPLRIGQEWGIVEYGIPWRVEPARDNVGAFLDREYSKAAHIFSDHFLSGGWEDVWFEKGVGVAGVHYIHNGTYDEYTKKLVSR